MRKTLYRILLPNLCLLSIRFGKFKSKFSGMNPERCALQLLSGFISYMQPDRNAKGRIPNKSRDRLCQDADSRFSSAKINVANDVTYFLNRCIRRLNNFYYKHIIQNTKSNFKSNSHFLFPESNEKFLCPQVININHKFKIRNKK
jgi:hypothetical protein